MDWKAKNKAVYACVCMFVCVRACVHIIICACI